MKLKLAFKYLFYRFFARHRYGHGIHSPFSYSFIRDVLVKQESDDRIKKLSNWHRRIRKAKIPQGEVNFGAGSRYKRITAGDIGISPKYAKLLYRITKYFSPSLIIELGTGSGISTAYLAGGNEKSQVITVEGDPLRSKFAQNLTAELELNNCEFITADFDIFLQKFKPVNKPFLAFIDGNHKLHSTIAYFEYFKSFADEDSLIIFDDIRWSEEMERAWKKISNDPSVTVSIDLFFIGIVFFKKSVTPQKLIVNF